jgi:RHS repeat-associated protein
MRFGYRFAFNGKEKDDEVSGSGNSYDYGFRIYNPRLGKFLSVDPLTQSYPWYTPYQFAGNMPIAAIDLDGLEEYLVINKYFKDSRGRSHIYVTDYQFIQSKSRVDITANSAINFGNYEAKNGVLRNNNNSYNATSSSIKNERWGKTKIRAAIRSGGQFSRMSNSTKASLDQKRSEMNSQTAGSGNINSKVVAFSLTLEFEPDGGRLTEEVVSQIKSNSELRDNFDVIAQYLINVPGATAEVAGFASPIPTNIDGTQAAVSDANNLELSQQRANSLKSALVSYITTVLEVTDFDESRITATGRGSAPAKSASGSEEEKNKAFQSSKVSVTPN